MSFPSIYGPSYRGNAAKQPTPYRVLSEQRRREPWRHAQDGHLRILRYGALFLVLASLSTTPLRARPRSWHAVSASEATILSPTPGSTLPGSTVTFKWATGSDVRGYRLDLNTKPGDPDDPASTRFFSTGWYSSTSVTVAHLPTNGETIYAILGSEINGSWHYITYAYKTATSSTGSATPVPTLGVSASSLSFGNVSLNTAVTQAITLTSKGTAAVTVNSDAVSGAGFTVSGATFPLTLNPGQTATLTVRFDPTAAGSIAGSLTLDSNSSSGSSTAISLSGTGVPVVALAGLSCTSGSLTGAGTDICTVTLSAAAATGGFAVSLASSNTVVTVPASVTVPAKSTTENFTATVSSVSSGAAVTLTASAGGVSKTFTLQLGTAVPTLTVNATAIAFGDVNLNSPATQSVTLTSSGTAAVTVSSATATGAGFSVSGATFPLTLNPSQTATLSIKFDPTAAGAVTGQLTIVSNSSVNPTDNITLTGTGASTVAYEVNLTWDAPTSSPQAVTGYNVYRAPSGSTSYQQINPSAVTKTAYTDTSVQDGQVYDYIVESLDAAGATSAPSNMASVDIP